MRIVVLLLVFLIPAYGQDTNHREIEKKPCGLTAALLYRPVVYAIWERDEGEHPHAIASGFIRIAIHPAWSAESFVDVRLNRDGPPTIIVYSLPKGVKTITSLLEIALQKNSCSDAPSLASALPIEKRTVAASKQSEELIAQFFKLRLEPRRIPNLIRLDATEYEVEFVGDDTLVFVSDDYETPMVKWVDSFLATLNANSRQ